MSSPKQRIAKAWRVRVDWSDDTDIVFAPSAGAARYCLMLDLGDCYPDLKFSEIKAWREKTSDRTLPAEHWIVPELSPEDRQVVMHAFGADQGRRATPGYRNHFCTHPGSTRLLRLTFELGLFHGPYGEGAYGATEGWSGAFFYLTDFGKHVARSMLPLYQ